MSKDMSPQDTAPRAAADLQDQARLLAAMAAGTAKAQEQVLELKRELSVLAMAEPRATAAEQALEQLRGEAGQLRARLVETEARCAAAETEAAAQRARAEQAETAYARIAASTSWRLTGPLRKLILLLRGHR